MGAALARPGAVCRDRRLRVRPGPARRLAISRLGGRGLQSRHALRPVRPPATCRRRGRPGDPWAFIATGFNRCYPDMVDLNDQGLRRQNALNDITETTGLVFLGLTIGCARCHDHKFDPIRQTDYYCAPGLLRRVPDSAMTIRWPRRAEATGVSERPRRVGARGQRGSVGLDPARGAARARSWPRASAGLERRDRRGFRETRRPSGPPRESSWSSTHSDGDRRIAPDAWKTVLDPATCSARQRLARRLDRLMRLRRRAAAGPRDRRDRPEPHRRLICCAGASTRARGPSWPPAFPARPLRRRVEPPVPRPTPLALDRPSQGAGRLAGSAPTIR